MAGAGDDWVCAGQGLDVLAPAAGRQGGHSGLPPLHGSSLHAPHLQASWAPHMPRVRLSGDVEVVVAVLEAGGEVNKAVGNRTNQQPAGSEGLHGCWSAPPARRLQIQLMAGAQQPQSRCTSTGALQHKASNHAAFFRNKQLHLREAVQPAQQELAGVTCRAGITCRA